MLQYNSNSIPFPDFQCVVYILTLSLEECGSDRSNGGPVVLPLVVPIHGGSDRGSGAAEAPPLFELNASHFSFDNKAFLYNGNKFLM